MSKKPTPNPEELDPPETTMEEADFSSAGESDLDGIDVTEPGEDASAGTAASGEAADPELAGVTVPQGAMPFEEWYLEAWIGGHEAANIVFRTQSLSAAPKSPHGRRAALGMYRTCCRVPLLHFVLAPGPEWMRDIAAIAVYAYFTGAGVAAEMMDRAAAAEAKAKAAASPEAASGESEMAGAPGAHDFAAKSA